MISQLLEDGQARVNITLQRGYAPPHFAHNLELILVEDNRCSESLSMKSKISSTRERAARLRALDPPTLIWWAMAFPMRQWSGGRKTNSRTFDSLIRRAPQFALNIQPLLEVVADDLELLRETHPSCQGMQEFLNAVSQELVASRSPISSSLDALSFERRHVTFSGARPDFPSKLAELLRQGIESSQRYRQEMDEAASISTAVEIFVPTVPADCDAYVVVPVGTSKVWGIMQELGIVREPLCA